MSIHRNLTGSDLHEPKGVDTATSGLVYVSNGGGSGSWTTLSSTGIANSAVTNAKLAGSITASKLVGTDITVVGTIVTGVWNAGAVTSTGIISTSATTVSSSTSTGSGVFAGGVGIGGVLNVAGASNIAGVLTITNSTQATVGTAGSIVTSGGIYSAKDIIWVGQAWASFTPTVTSTAGTTTAGSITATYTKLGKTVLFHVKLTLTAVGTGRVLLGLPAGELAVSGPGSIQGFNGTTLKAITGTMRYDSANTATIVLYDGTFPGVISDVLYITGFYEAA